VVFRRVVLPLALPGVAASCTLVFVLCMNTYATAVLLGGPRFKMMAPAVYDQVIRSNNWPMGATFGVHAVDLHHGLHCARKRRFRAALWQGISIEILEQLGEVTQLANRRGSFRLQQIVG
jgi:ABC-type spermidine/putrescine transport system permease subunit I